MYYLGLMIFTLICFILKLYNNYIACTYSMYVSHYKLILKYNRFYCYKQQQNKVFEPLDNNSLLYESMVPPLDGNWDKDANVYSKSWQFDRHWVRSKAVANFKNQFLKIPDFLHTRATYTGYHPLYTYHGWVTSQTLISWDETSGRRKKIKFKFEN